MNISICIASEFSRFFLYFLTFFNCIETLKCHCCFSFHFSFSRALFSLAHTRSSDTLTIESTVHACIGVDDSKLGVETFFFLSSCCLWGNECERTSKERREKGEPTKGRKSRRLCVGWLSIIWTWMVGWVSTAHKRVSNTGLVTSTSILFLPFSDFVRSPLLLTLCRVHCWLFALQRWYFSFNFE